MARPKRDGLLYFPFDTDFFYADKKIKRLHSKYGSDGLILYIYLLTEIYRNGYYISWDEEAAEDAAADLGLKEGFIKQAMAYLASRSLLTKLSILAGPVNASPTQRAGDGRPQRESAENGDGRERVEVITSPGIQKRYQEAVKSRKRDVYVDAEIWLLKKEETATCIKVTQKKDRSCGNESKSCGNESKSCGNDIKKSKAKKSKEYKNTMCKADALALFERLWKLYPLKRGKGQVSDAQKMKLLKIGYDEMARAIQRYRDYVDSVDYLHYKNGDTFFNGGYVDYLDANYLPVNEGKKSPEKKNAFTDYPHRDYDFDQIKKSMFEQ